MGLKTFGSGWDPNSGWAPDDSTSVQWEPEVDINAQYQGAGQGFGPGGFPETARLYGPTTGQKGLSLSSVPGGGGASVPPEVMPPTNRTIPLNKSVGPFTGGTSTENAWDPRNWFKADPTATFEAGKPMGQIASGGAVPSLLTGAGSPYWKALIAAGGAIAPTPAETGEFTPAEPNFVRPDAPRGDGLPAPAAAAPQMGMPWAGNNYGRSAGAPIGSPAPGSPAPAVTRQRPNLGTYAAPPAAVPNSPFTTLDYRPNSGPNERNRGSPVATALDLSRLFGGGQPAPAVAPAAAPAAAPARPQPVYRQPSMQMVPPGPMDASIIARQRRGYR